MTSKALMQETQKYIIKKPQHREYERKGDPLIKVVNAHKCHFCDWENLHILATAAHIKREHAEEMKKLEEQEQKEAEEQSQKAAKNPVPEAKPQERPNKKDLEKHELHFEEIKPAAKKKSFDTPASHQEKQKDSRISPSKPTSDDDPDDWLDFFED